MWRREAGKEDEKEWLGRKPGEGGRSQVKKMGRGGGRPGVLNAVIGPLR